MVLVSLLSISSFSFYPFYFTRGDVFSLMIGGIASFVTVVTGLGRFMAQTDGVVVELVDDEWLSGLSRLSGLSGLNGWVKIHGLCEGGEGGIGKRGRQENIYISW